MSTRRSSRLGQKCTEVWEMFYWKGTKTDEHEDYYEEIRAYELVNESRRG